MLYCCVATLNNREHTQRLIDALAQVQGIPLRVIAVDNGSTDGTVEWLRSVAAVTVIENERNLGAAGAWNLGLRVAVANNADAILLCGNDTAPMPGTVERLYGLLQQGVLFVTGTQVPYETPVAPVPPCGADEVLVAAPDFSFALFKPVVLSMIGQWDAAVAHQVTQQAMQAKQPLPAVVMEPWNWGYFDARCSVGYWEDVDYHIRAKQAGVLLLRDEGALFRHDCSLTIRTHPDLAELNHRETFKRNADLIKAKWGDYMANFDVQQAKPGNVSDEQWTALSGGRAVIELPRDEAIARAKVVYARYGIEV